MTIPLLGRKKRKQDSRKPDCQPATPPPTYSNSYHPAQPWTDVLTSLPPPYVRFQQAQVRPRLHGASSRACLVPVAVPVCSMSQRYDASAKDVSILPRPKTANSLKQDSLPNGYACNPAAGFPNLPVRHVISSSKNNDCPIAGYMNQGAALCDRISTKLNDIITCIDGDVFGGDDKELGISRSTVLFVKSETSDSVAGIAQHPSPVYGSLPSHLTAFANQTLATVPDQTTKEDHFSKVHLYANSRLPPYLLPLKVYMPTWRLLCLAAQHSESVYTRPSGAERKTFIDADWRHGTKAMVLKSLPIDDANTIVFAVRGSQTFMDWAVNFRPVPSSAQGFLDDPGNLCHSGFLSVAKKMVKPVAARLRQLLEENPSRSNCSLLITGHSAGGAVASLLYMHMLAETVVSELTVLTNCFKRVHCVMFGAPPVSLLPLQKSSSPRHKKSIFFSFVNQGDPVVRADKEYVKSILRLYALPAPNEPSTSNSSCTILAKPNHKSPRVDASLPPPVWKLPPATLSNAGRLVLLRERSGKVGLENIEACCTTDEELRGVVFGDPVMHMMKVYAARIERLATLAVTGRDFG
ncbi:hypothetical protein LTR66_000176 [Elasticomyces elasticus]|nr:hypothetical protein LTR66_000176 [Elasticomyces elasticus]